MEEQITDDYEKNIYNLFDYVWLSVNRWPNPEHAKYNVTLFENIFHVCLLIFIRDHPSDIMHDITFLIKNNFDNVETIENFTIAAKKIIENRNVLN